MDFRQERAWQRQFQEQYGGENMRRERDEPSQVQQELDRERHETEKRRTALEQERWEYEQERLEGQREDERWAAEQNRMKQEKRRTMKRPYKTRISQGEEQWSDAKRRGPIRRHRVTGHYDNRTQQRRPARGQYGHRGGRYGRHNVRHRETDLTDDRCPRQERPRADRGSEETARYEEYCDGPPAREPEQGRSGHYGSPQWDVPWESTNSTDHHTLESQHVQGGWKTQRQTDVRDTHGAVGHPFFGCPPVISHDIGCHDTWHNAGGPSSTFPNNSVNSPNFNQNSGHMSKSFGRGNDPVPGKLVTDIVRILCSTDTGQMSVDSLCQILASSRLCSDPKIIENTLYMYGQNFCMLKDQNGRSVVKAVTDLEVCPDNCTTPYCDQLHICRFYMIADNCKFGPSCRYGHLLNSAHNTTALSQRNLEGLTVQQLRVLLKPRQSEDTKFPPICKFYNKGDNACKKGSKCLALHVCRFYILQECTFGTKCKRSHNVYDDQNKKRLIKFGVDVMRTPKEVLKELRAAIEDTSENTSSQKDCSKSSIGAPTSTPNATGQTASASDDGDILICLFNLRGKCLYADRCQNLHANSPYQWQYQLRGIWYNFEDSGNKELELNYCDPVTEACFTDGTNLPSAKKTGPCRVDFELMQVTWSQQDAGQVRRVSSIASVKAQPTHQLTTRWLWYWQNEYGEWIEYGKPGPQNHVSATLTSNEIEDEYQSDSSRVVSFSTPSDKYELKFKQMRQTNIQSETERLVRRRPDPRGFQDNIHVAVSDDNPANDQLDQ